MDVQQRLVNITIMLLLFTNTFTCNINIHELLVLVEGVKYVRSPLLYCLIFFDFVSSVVLDRPCLQQQLITRSYGARVNRISCVIY